jgi:putative endonuclease
MTQAAVYIMASQRNGTLYIGVTSDLLKRVWRHKQDAVPGFTNRYAVHMLVYYQQTEEMQSAIIREKLLKKQLKKWNRAWKIRLIEEMNPHWNDLYDSIS